MEVIEADVVVASVGGGGLLSGITSCYRASGKNRTKYTLLLLRLLLIIIINYYYY